jgi:hypothetical protein
LKYLEALVALWSRPGCVGVFVDGHGVCGFEGLREAF